MGISSLHPALSGAMTAVDLAELAGQTAVVDISCYIYKGIYAGNTSYVHRILGQMVDFGVTPIAVFDGETPEAKQEAMDGRQKITNKRREKAIAAGRGVDAAKLTRRGDRRFEKAMESIVQFCELRAIPYVRAPHEADAQMAYMLRNGLADFAVSEDSDLIVFNCKKVLYKLTQGSGVLYNQAHFEASWGGPYNEECFSAVCICLGCDYLPGGLRDFGIAIAKAIYPQLLPHFNFDKLILVLKQYPRVKIREGFRASFQRALDTFKHQIVLDPRSQKLVPLTPYENGKSHADFPFAGTLVEGPKVKSWTPPSGSGPLKSVPGTSSSTLAGLMLPCSYCLESYATWAELREHKRASHFSCPECSRSFAKKFILLDHMDRHLPDPIHPCDQCEPVSMWWTKIALADHKRQTHTDKEFPCPKCGRVFKQNFALTEHLKYIDCTKPKKAFPCTQIVEEGKVCKSSFDTRNGLALHMRNYHNLNVDGQPKRKQKWNERAGSEERRKKRDEFNKKQREKRKAQSPEEREEERRKARERYRGQRKQENKKTKFEEE